MELCHIAANKNTVPGDVSAMVPGGIRMGMNTLVFCYMFLDISTKYQVVIKYWGLSNQEP